MPKNQKKKYKYFSLIAILFVSSFFLLSPHAAYAGIGDVAWAAVEATFNATFGLIIKAIFYAILQVLGMFLSVAVSLFGYVVDAAHFQQLFQLPAVYEMWKFIRDFFNLFFILSLLYIAFTIIFQIASDYKKTLLSLVLAALFINFSFPISRALIDAANVPMYFFINQAVPAKDMNSPEKALGTVLSASNIKDILIPQSVGNFYSRSLAQYIMSIIVMFLMSVSLLVLATMLLIRILALFILVIFSSVGFAGAVIPGMQKYSSMWWDNFAKYALFGPASMLMLLITVRILESLQSSGFTKDMGNVVRKNVADSDITNVTAMATYLVPIILLWFTIGLAQTMSLAGAGSVVGTAQKFSKWAGKLPLAGAKFGGRKYEKWAVGKGNAGKYFAPSTYAGAWKAWREESAHKDKAPIERAAAVMQDRANRIFGEHTNHAFAVAQAQKNKAAKEISDVSTNSDYVIKELRAARGHNGKGNVEEVEGALSALAKDNNLNDLLASLTAEEIKRYGIEMHNLVDEEGKPLLDADGKQRQKVKINPMNFQKVMVGMLEDVGVDRNSEEMAMKVMVLSDTATASGNYAAGGLSNYDTDKGKFKLSKVEEHAKWAAGKVKNLESQKRQTSMHPDSVFETYIDDDGNKQFIDLTAAGEEIFKTFTLGDVEEARRSRDDMKQGTSAMEKKRKAGKPSTRFGNAIAANSNVKLYAEKVYGMSGTPAPANQNTQPGGTGAGAIGSMSSGQHGSPIAMPVQSVGGGARKNP